MIENLISDLSDRDTLGEFLDMKSLKGKGMRGVGKRVPEVWVSGKEKKKIVRDWILKSITWSLVFQTKE